MLRVGLTGGIACGKTTVAEMMAARGAHVIQADAVAHELMSPGQKVYDDVVQRFGESVLKPDKTIDREKLADVAFGAGRVKELNDIVHPVVVQRQTAWFAEQSRKDPTGIAVVEAALILEAGINELFDKLVVITCPRKQKIERCAHRAAEAGGFSEIKARKEAERRIAAQMADEEKVKAADFVIDNSGSLKTVEEQVDNLMLELKKLADVPA